MLEIAEKNIQSNSLVKGCRKVFIKVDSVLAEDDRLIDEAHKKIDIFINLLIFLKDNYSYVDIYNPDIKRPEVIFFMKKLRKLGVVYVFYGK